MFRTGQAPCGKQGLLILKLSMAKIKSDFRSARRRRNGIH